MGARFGAAAVLLGLAAAGCGHAAASDRDRADARGYAAVAARFNRLVPTLITRAERRTARTFQECSLVRNGDPHVPPPARLTGISFVASYQALLPAYRALAVRLRAVGAEDPTLRAVANEAADLERRYSRVGAARPDFCHTLRRWQAQAWRLDFSVMRTIGVTGRAFDESGTPRDPAIRRAEGSVAAAGERLRGLGLSEADAKEVLKAVDAFAAVRGGYPEIRRLAARHAAAR